MKIFKLERKRNSYEELLPIPPRRGAQKYLNTVLLGLLLTVAGTAMILLVVNLAGTAPSEKVETLGQNTPTVGTAEQEILIDLTYGQIRGKRMVARGGREYLAFIGVPYAKPPIGNLRFTAPEEVESWNGTLDTREFKPQCLQLAKDAEGNVIPSGAEDCLYLNIYSSKKMTELSSRRARFPVMFYIHGGVNNGNGSQYGADYFMDLDVVLVFVHYRLHVLGNLNTEDSVARGNFGIKDQVRALMWVRDNISKFGGNRRKVTIFGNSSGAVATSIHILSPMSKGLFHQIICQSGNVLSPSQFSRNPRSILNDLADKVKCPTNTSQELIDCLRTVDAGELTILVRDMEFYNTIESPSETPAEDTCIPDQPLKLLQSGQINPVTSIYGDTAEESLVFTLGVLLDQNMTRELNQNWNEFMTDALALDYGPNLKNITKTLREFYISSQNVTDENLANLTDLYSDRYYVHPTKVLASYHLQNKGRREAVYLYYLSKQGPRSFATTPMKLYDPTDTDFGPVHADEVQFLFPNGKFPRIDVGSEYANFSQMLVRTWVNFAATGVPSDADNGEEWLELNAAETQAPKWFILDDESRMGDPVRERMKLWDSFNQSDLYF